MDSRRDFLKKALGTTLAAAAIPALGEVFQSPAFASGQSFGTLTLDLSLSKFSPLKTIGGSYIYTPPSPNSGSKILIIRETDQTFSVLTAICTHKSCVLDYEAPGQPVYDPDTELITCTCHDSEFDVHGVVVTPQVKNQANLRQYQYTYNSAANKLIISDGTAEAPSVTTAPFLLEQNSPNPFSTHTAISFAIPSAGRITLRITDELGKEISTIHDGFLSEGKHSFDVDGSSLSSGIYFYRLTTPNGTLIKQMVKK